MGTKTDKKRWEQKRILDFPILFIIKQQKILLEAKQFICFYGNYFFLNYRLTLSNGPKSYISKKERRK